MPAPAERAFVATPFAGAGARVIASPFQFLVDADSFLRVTSVCSVASVVLAVQGRRYDSEQVLRPIVESHSPNSNRTTKTQDYKVGDGAILNLTVFASSGTPLIGQCYVMVQLLRNLGSTAIVLGTLLGGYVTATQALGFPGSPIVSSTDGEPAVRTITGTLPAAGAEFSEVVPTGARWEVLGLTAQLTTNGVAGARVPALQLMTPFSIIAASPFTSSIAAALTQVLTWAVGVPIAAAAGVTRWAAPLPAPNRLLAQQAIQSLTVNLNAGDQWTAPVYTVREWLEVN